jgi:hypothetical protein
VQKAEHFIQLFRLSVTGKGFCVAASLLILAATTLCAGEPVMTLAMNHPSEKSSVASSMDLMPKSDIDSSLLNLKNNRHEAASVNDEKPMVSPAASPNEKPDNFGQPESFPLTRENPHPSKPVSIQAGYGRIWDDQSTLQKIASDHQEHGCAYVSANFSF